MTESAHTEPTGLRVLVLDDDRDSADSLAVLLRVWGHDICVAYDGLTTLELARIHRPDVAILDLRLPGMDGIEVAERLHRQPESRDTVLIAITGLRKAEIQQHSAACAFAHYLRKPADPDQLRDLLVGLLAIRLKERRPSNKGTKRMPLPKGLPQKGTKKMPLPKELDLD
jgi:CheY-like chemotaxis protein